MEEITIKLQYSGNYWSRTMKKRLRKDIASSFREAIGWIKENIQIRAAINYRESLSASNLLPFFSYVGIDTDETTLIFLMKVSGFESNERNGETYFNISDRSEFLPRFTDFYRR